MKVLLHGDCLDELKRMKDNSVDSVVTDPPYGISFMGKKWDYDVPSVDVWKECLRVLKPGGHLLSFSGSRTYHRMAVRIEDAGFEIRDQIMWIYGSGFPKGKTQLKPAHEPIVMARKPGPLQPLNIDECRIEYKNDKPNSIKTERERDNQSGWASQGTLVDRTEDWEPNSTGRWPANIILDEDAGQVLDEQSGITQYNKSRKEGNYKGGHRKDYVGTDDNPIVNKVDGKFFSDKGGASRFFYCPKASKKDRNEGLEEFEEYTSGKNGRGLDRMCSVCGSKMINQKDCVCENPNWIDIPKKNHHPTVKPTDLMLYLIKLVTPKGGWVMDPYMGSGSTGKAAIRGGFDFVGIEREEEYLNIAKARIEKQE